MTDRVEPLANEIREAPHGFVGLLRNIGPGVVVSGSVVGSGELLVTSMDADGHQNGFELELTAAISGTLNIPVIASGGGGTFEHFRDAFTIGKADAVLAASVFHYGKYTVSQVKDYLSENNIPVRKV